MKKLLFILVLSLVLSSQMVSQNVIESQFERPLLTEPVIVVDKPQPYHHISIGSSIDLNLVRFTYGYQRQSGVYGTIEGNYEINKYSFILGYSYRFADYFTPFIGGGISTQDGDQSFRKELGVMSRYKTGMITRFGFSFTRGVTFAIGISF